MAYYTIAGQVGHDPSYSVRYIFKRVLRMTFADIPVATEPAGSADIAFS